MKYRTFGSLDWEASALGFGAMRLPHAGDDYSAILEDQATAMLRRAIDGGVNYIDTAEPYHRGNSESFLGRALKDGYRDRVRVVTKLPCWKVEKTEDFDRCFDEQMEKLQLSHLDFYLLHALQRDWWDRMSDLGFLDWAERKMADGAIGHIGFSFHDKPPLFKRIVDGYDGWTLAMVMCNYMDVEYQAGLDGVKYAADRGLAVVAMEPLRGGLLAKDPPASVREVFDSSPVRRAPVEWALRWLWDRPELSLVLSGMSTMEQVEQNLAIASDSGPGCMSEDEHRLIDDVREAYRSKALIPCTDCRYCMPCPQGVSIPWVFEYFNMAAVYEDPDAARQQYTFLGEKHSADLCNECGKCQELCPQHIGIIKALKEAHSLLSAPKKD